MINSKFTLSMISFEEREKIKRLCGVEELPPYANKIIKSFYEVDNFYFYLSLPPKKSIHKVDFNRIIGSSYWDSYRGWTWLEMILNLRRTNIDTIEKANSAIDNPSSDYDKPVYFKVGEEYFVIAGHHRTCIAKFGGRKEALVETVEYFFDKEIFNAYQLLKEKFEIDLNYFDKPLLPHTIHTTWILTSKILGGNFKLSLNDRNEILDFYKYCKILKIPFCFQIRLKIKEKFRLIENIIATPLGISKTDSHYYIWSFKERYFKEIKEKLLLCKLY